MMVTVCISCSDCGTVSLFSRNTFQQCKDEMEEEGWDSGICPTCIRKVAAEEAQKAIQLSLNFDGKVG